MKKENIILSKSFEFALEIIKIYKLLVSDQDVGTPLSESSGANIIGGDAKSEDGSGSDLELGNETLQPGSDGSDVNLVPSEGQGSDVSLVASDSGLGSDVGIANDSDLLLFCLSHQLISGIAVEEQCCNRFMSVFGPRIF